MIKKYATFKQLALSLGLLLAPALVFGQLGTDVFTVGSDDGSSYGGTLANGSTGGSGFGAWSITYGGSTGSYVGSPAGDGMGTTGIGTTAFAFYATSTNYVNAVRPITDGLRVGDKFTFYWAVNWDVGAGGAKGFDLRDGGSTIFNVNMGASATITTTNGTAFTTYGTDPMLVTLERTSSSTYSFTMSPRNVADATYSTTINSSSDIDELHIYIGGQLDNNGNRNMYFGNFQKTSKYNIPNGSSTTASADITVPFLDIESGGTVNVAANTDLTVSGALENAGTLNLLSNASGNYAQVLANSSSGAGTFTVQRTLTGSARWFYIGSPISGGTVANLSVSDGVINTGSAANVNLYYYDPATANAGEGTWTKVPNTTFSTVNKGFSIYLGGGSTFGTLPITVTATGNGFNDGAINIALDNSNSGWNLVSNPYPSAIDWNAYYDANSANLTSTYYVYNGSQWIGYDANANSALNSGTTLIAPMQAFFVQNTGSGSINLALDNADRSVASAPSQNKTASTMHVLKIGVLAADGTSDETLMAFDSQFTDGWDNGVDAVKRMNANHIPNIFTTSATGEEFFANKMNDAFSMKSIPLSFTSGIAQLYTISINDLRLPDSWEVELEDIITGNRVDLKANPYQFAHAVGNSPERFVVHINQTGVGQEELSSSNNYAYSSENAFNFVLAQEMPELEVHVFSQGGQLVWEGSFESASQASISTNNLARGVYIIKVSSKGAPVLSQKLIK